MKSKRIKHNDLLPWFLQDHGTLPAAYLASCEKFFNNLKPQAASSKQQAKKCLTPDPGYDRINLERKTHD